MSAYGWRKTASGWRIAGRDDRTRGYTSRGGVEGAGGLARRAAIVDPPRGGLSNIFVPGTEELVPEVQRSVDAGLERIRAHLEAEHPGVEVVDHEMIGASVTEQYSPTSDIDTTVFINLGRDDPRFELINRWIGDNVDGRMKFRGRPYQFKIMPESTRGQNDNADAVYRPGRGFTKRPGAGRAAAEFGRLVEDPRSAERVAYAQMEVALQALARLWAREARAALEADDPGRYMGRLGAVGEAMVERAGLIKKVRGTAYSGGAGDRISQNWGSGNVIYKFLERDGYLALLKAVKGALADGRLHPHELMASVSLAEAVASGAVGFDPRGDDPTAHVTFGRDG